MTSGYGFALTDGTKSGGKSSIKLIQQLGYQAFLDNISITGLPAGGYEVKGPAPVTKSSGRTALLAGGTASTNTNTISQITISANANIKISDLTIRGVTL